MNRAGRLILVRVVMTATPIYLMIAFDLPKWVIKAVDKGEVFYGKDKNKQMEAIVSFHGKEYNARLSMVAWGSIILKNLAGLLGSVDFGPKKQTPQDLGLVFRFKFLSAQKQCFAWRLTVLLVTGNRSYSGRTGG